MNHSERVTFPSRPAAGLVPRGLVGTEYTSGRIVWGASRGDLIQAHRRHIATARYFRTYHAYLGSAGSLEALEDAATIRRLLSPAKARSILPIIREQA